MKKKVIATLLLLILMAGAVMLAVKSYQKVDDKLKLDDKSQMTMEIKLSPTPKPTVTPLPGPTATPAPPVDPEAPVLILVSDKVEIAQGGSFDLIGQVQDITDNKDDRSRLFRNIQVHGSYDVNTPGEYVLEYFAVDSDGNPSPRQQLTLVVKAP